MAFDNLTEKLQNVFKNLRSKGRLTEEDVKAALKEVKMALLEADVNFKVVKNFVKTVQERAIGQDVLNSLTPGQMVIKLVNEELVSLMGSEMTEIALKPSNEITVLLMCGLQGAGKTTTTAGHRCSSPVIFTVRRQLNSCRLMEKSRAWKSFLWGRTTGRWILQRRPWNTLLRIKIML